MYYCLTCFDSRGDARTIYLSGSRSASLLSPVIKTEKEEEEGKAREVGKRDSGSKDCKLQPQNICENLFYLF